MEASESGAGIGPRPKITQVPLGDPSHDGRDHHRAQGPGRFSDACGTSLRCWGWVVAICQRGAIVACRWWSAPVMEAPQPKGVQPSPRQMNTIEFSPGALHSVPCTWRCGHLCPSPVEPGRRSPGHGGNTRTNPSRRPFLPFLERPPPGGRQLGMRADADDMVPARVCWNDGVQPLVQVLLLSVRQRLQPAPARLGVSTSRRHIRALKRSKRTWFRLSSLRPRRNIRPRPHALGPRESASTDSCPAASDPRSEPMSQKSR